MKYVISGASAALGKLTADNLLRQIPAANLTMITRNPVALADWKARGVRVLKGHHGDKESLKEGYAGADCLFMISSLAIGKREVEHDNAISVAKDEGIQHITYTSVAGAHPENPTPSASEHVITERLLWKSGISFAALRNQLYSELIYSMITEMAIRTGKWVLNCNTGQFSPVSRKDIATCVSAIMLSPQKHDRVVYEITGPERMTFPALAKMAEQLWHKPIEYVPVTDQQMYDFFDRIGVQRAGDPSAKKDAQIFGSDELVPQFHAYEKGMLDVCSGHVKYITGNEPVALEVVLREMLDALR